jgi:transcription initiation factor TFIIIB Brf1 subunit/transcription initiation factor TFIIB
VRGSLSFQITPDQQIKVSADLYELTDLDILRISTALTEQVLNLQLTLIKKTVEKLETKKIVAEAQAESFKKKVDENLR